MDRTTAVELARTELHRKRHRDEVIRSLCSYGTLAWSDAEVIVAEAELHHTSGHSFQFFLLLLVAFVGIITIAGMFFLL